MVHVIEVLLESICVYFAGSRLSRTHDTVTSYHTLTERITIAITITFHAQHHIVTLNHTSLDDGGRNGRLVQIMHYISLFLIQWPVVTGRQLPAAGNDRIH